MREEEEEEERRKKEEGGKGEQEEGKQEEEGEGWRRVGERGRREEENEMRRVLEYLEAFFGQVSCNRDRFQGEGRWRMGEEGWSIIGRRRQGRRC